MLPVALVPDRLPVALVGRGSLVVRRLELLREAGAAAVTLFSDAPSPALSAAAPGLCRRLPEAADLAGHRLLYVTELERPQAAALAALARAAGLLVNVEDDPALCDFHSPSVIRRGDLTLAIATGGRSPGLARALRLALERLFDARWGERLALLAALRQRWRAEGHSPQRVRDMTDQLLRRRGWLPADRRDAA